MGREQSRNWGWRGSYFVEFCYLRQRDRLAEDVARVLLLQLLEGPAQEDEEGGQLHLQRHLLNFDLKQRGEAPLSATVSGTPAPPKPGPLK